MKQIKTKTIHNTPKWIKIGWNEANIEPPNGIGIYKFTILGKPYIGMSSNIYARYYQHMSQAKKQPHKKLLYKMMAAALDTGTLEFEVLVLVEPQPN